MSVAEKMTAIADAIRDKTGKTDRLSLDEMATEINEISTGERDINPEWTDWRYFSYYDNRNDLVAKLKYSDTSKGTDFSYMFRYCKKLLTIPEIDVSNADVTTCTYMFANCEALVELPRLNFKTGDGKQRDINFGNAFNNCKALTTIQSIDMSCNGSYQNPFGGCTSLANITIEGVLMYGCGYNFQECPLTHDSLLSILNALVTTTASNAKLTIGSNNLSKLTADEIAIAEGKGWTLA